MEERRAYNIEKLYLIKQKQILNVNKKIMKLLKQNNRYLKIIVGILFLTTVGFAIYQSQWLQERKQNIVGTWICDSTPEWKVEFTNNGISYWHYPGETTEEYNYTVNSEITQSGLEITFVKLINVNNPNDIIEYDINGLSNDKMVLTVLTPKIDYIHFTKQ